MGIVLDLFVLCYFLSVAQISLCPTFQSCTDSNSSSRICSINYQKFNLLWGEEAVRETGQGRRQGETQERKQGRSVFKASLIAETQKKIKTFLAFKNHERIFRKGLLFFSLTSPNMVWFKPKVSNWPKYNNLNFEFCVKLAKLVSQFIIENNCKLSEHKSVIKFGLK